MLEQLPQTRLRDPRFVPMLVSLLVSLLMLTGKVAAFVITGSAAIYSDAAESVIHLFATVLVAITIWYSLKPADPSHPYGHGKATYFSAGFEGALIMLAAVAIFYAAIQDLIRGPDLQQLGVGLLLLAGLTIINLLLGLYLVRSGKKYNNIGLVSNGQHVLTDMWTSVGVIVGVFLVWLTDIVWLDPVVAMLIALNILHTAYGLLKQSFEGLMEKSEPEDTQAILGELERALRADGIEGYHQLRHRQIGDQRWIEYHLLFDGTMPLEEAHERSHEVEARIAALFDGEEVVITAHLEPSEHDEAHPKGHVEPDDPLTGIGANL